MKTPILVATSGIFVVLVGSVLTLLVTGHDPSGFVGFLPSLAATAAVLFVANNTNKKVDTVQKQTNGTLAAKDAAIAHLTATLASVTTPAIATQAAIQSTTKTEQELPTMSPTVGTDGRIIGDPDGVDETTAVIYGKEYVLDGENYVPATEAEPVAGPEPVEIGGAWFVQNAAGGYDPAEAPITPDPTATMAFMKTEPGVNP